MKSSPTTLFRFFFVALALIAGGAVHAGSFTLDPPSPSWPDSNDILRDEPGPLAALPRLGVSSITLGLQPFDWINALSDGRDPIDEDLNPGKPHLIFSVRRGSAGLPGTAVEQERLSDTAPPAGGNPNGQASDLFTWDGSIGMNDLATPALGWASGLGGDEANTHLRIPTTNQRGDNVDGYDRSTMRVYNPADCQDGNADCNPDDNPNPWGGGGGVSPPYPIFFSLRSGSPTLALIGASAGDILAVGGPFGATPVVFVPHAALNLPVWADLDALNLEVAQNAVGQLVLHRVRFSVRSATTGFALPDGTVVSSGADILYHDGVTTTLLHAANDLGLRGEDDLDALESEVTSIVVPGFDPPVVVPVEEEAGPVASPETFIPKRGVMSAAQRFRRGDADGNGVVALADAIATLNALFLGETTLSCADAADSNDDGAVSLADAVATLDALFAGNVVIAAPGTNDCGADPTKDAIGCDVYDSCE